VTGIERMTNAIRFAGGTSIPLEIHDVPHLYDAYGTLDPATVQPAAKSYDGIRVTYHWTFTEETASSPLPLSRRSLRERPERGTARLRRDEWGCLQRVPDDLSTAYEVIEKPLSDPQALADYRFPDPAVSDLFFERTRRVITERYPDKFVCGYVDPGPLLVAFNLMGYDGLLMRLHDDLPQVLAVMRGIVDVQKGIIDRWAAAGAHMVSIIDEFAGTDGLMFSPALWREHFAPLYAEIFGHIKSHGLFCGCLFDGDITAIMDDYLALQPDVVEIMQPNLVGIERWGELLRGKVCAKASVDMMTTLATGTPAQCVEEVHRLVRALHTPEGGFIGVSLRWHRPEYPAASVAAVAEELAGYR
jgi:uroporphyrinogen decarboxylase